MPTKEARRPFTFDGPGPSSPTFISNDALQPWAIIMQTYWLLEKTLDRRLQTEAHVTSSQARVLMAIANGNDGLNRGAKPSAIATLLLQETQSITGIIQRIDAQGLIERVDDPDDGRAVRLSLSETGEKMVAKIEAVMDSVFADAFLDARLVDRDRIVVELLPLRKHLLSNISEIDYKLRRVSRFKVWSD